MRRALPLAALAATLCASFTLHAQNDRFAYAITDLSKEGAGWNALRKIDLQTGQYSDVLLNGSDVKAVVYSAATRKQLVQQADARYGTMLQSPFATGVAAAAYDKKHNRLYFTPMFVDQLRYIDLKTMKVYYVTDQALTSFGNMHNDEAKIITRMVIAPDGYGYAISNDGNTFIRFSTGKKTTSIEQLGGLADDASNGTVSIHNRCSSFGGDMISDDKGNLFILSARNSVFTVNTKTKVAKYLGAISGLEQNFTVNGAVVDAEGKLLVSSAVDGNTYYVIDPLTWNATPYKAANGIFRSSDLANSNYLTTKKTPKLSDSELQRLIRPEEKFANLIAVYPNPVTSSTIRLQFEKVPAGNYIVELRDVLGRTVTQRRINITSETQTQELKLDRRNSSGIYMVKLFDAANQSVFTQKLLVQ
jgi:hypothetical protein